MQRLIPLFFLCALTPVFAASPLTVLHDSGDTQPLAPLLEASGFNQEAEASDLPPIAPPMDVVLQQYVTVRSPSLSPGVQPRIAVGKAGTFLPRPIFLVGADEASLSWLANHRIALVHAGCGRSGGRGQWRGRHVEGAACRRRSAAGGRQWRDAGRAVRATPLPGVDRP